MLQKKGGFDGRKGWINDKEFNKGIWDGGDENMYDLSERFSISRGYCTGNVFEIAASL